MVILFHRCVCCIGFVTENATVAFLSRKTNNYIEGDCNVTRVALIKET